MTFWESAFAIGVIVALLAIEYQLGNLIGRLDAINQSLQNLKLK